jgi:hypothetical protein
VDILGLVLVSKIAYLPYTETFKRDPLKYSLKFDLGVGRSHPIIPSQEASNLGIKVLI